MYTVNAPALVASAVAVVVISEGLRARYRHLKAQQKSSTAAEMETLRLWTTIFPGMG